VNFANESNLSRKVPMRTHDIPVADAMTEFMKEGWAPSPLTGITAHPSIPNTKLRREKLTKFIYLVFRINVRPKPRRFSLPMCIIKVF
jgi:hypothetical protein